MTTMDDNPLLARVTELAEEVKKLSKMVERQINLPSTPLYLRQLSVEDSARYVYETFPHVTVMTYRHETVAYAARRAANPGLFLEFGVDEGTTINQFAKLRPDVRVFGFDSFEGLPEDWGGTSLLKGRFDRKGKMPAVPDNVTLVRGWFNETIPPWKAEHPEEIAFCHVDCDLYSSTVTIFTELEDRFRKGTILLFDEYFGYADWRHGEHKAFLEMIERTGFAYKALAISHQALVVELGDRTA